MSSAKKRKIYSVVLSYGSTKVRKRIKVEHGAEPEFEMVPVFAVGLLVDDRLVAVLPITEIDRLDAENIMVKAGIQKELVAAIITEIDEEMKEEKQIRLD